MSSPTPSQKAEIHDPICITKHSILELEGRDIRDHQVKSFCQGWKGDQSAGQTGLVGDRAGSEPRVEKGCSRREVTQSGACHVCDTGALGRDESSH